MGQHAAERYDEVENDVGSRAIQNGNAANGEWSDDEDLKQGATAGQDHASEQENSVSIPASAEHISAERRSDIAMIGADLSHHDSEESADSFSAIPASGTETQDTSDREKEEDYNSDDDGDDEQLEKLLQAAKVSASKAGKGNSGDLREGEVEEVALQFDKPDEEATHET